MMGLEKKVKIKKSKFCTYMYINIAKKNQKKGHNFKLNTLNHKPKL